MSEVLAAVSRWEPARASDLNAQDPWPGLVSYTEEDKAYFAAREAECDELTERVLQQRLTVLYGLSGLGKSSLVQAGLFPALRAHRCLPVYVRINFAPEAPPLVDQVFAAVEAAALAARATMPARQNGETLWEYFQRRDNAFWSRRNWLMTPVLSFDQFEEIFTLGAFRRAEESKAFLEAITDLAEGRAPRAVKARLDRSPAETARRFDFSAHACRVLLSLREDYLAHLEDLRHLMPAMGNRMRLRPLNGIQALTVVRQPGGSLVSQAVAEEIVVAVAGARQRERPPEEKEVDPALLCLLCRELNKRRIKDAAAQISAAMLSEQMRAGILGEFYEDAVGRVSETARRFVEDKLLLASGQRDSVALEVAHDAGIDDAQIEILVAERLVRREERGGVVRLELTHDVLTEVVRASRDQRRERETREQAEREREQARRAALEAERRLRRSRRVAITVSMLLLMAVGLLGFFAEGLYWATNHKYPLQALTTRWAHKLNLGKPIPMPELVRIPAGTFEMGEAGNEQEEPVHRVTIAQPFYLASTEVTFAQYDVFQEATGRDRAVDENWGRGDRPVINVSWFDARAYAEWLSTMTGGACRLPSEAEWEYAARAGTRTRYALPAPDGGDDLLGRNLANCSECGAKSPPRTTPVRTFPANAWGLYDMHGNVYEFVQDCAHKSYKGAPGDGRAWVEQNSEQRAWAEQTGGQCERIVRGGSWFNVAAFARSAARDFNDPELRSSDLGFRVLCSSPIGGGGKK